MTFFRERIYKMYPGDPHIFKRKNTKLRFLAISDHMFLADLLECVQDAGKIPCEKSLPLKRGSSKDTEGLTGFFGICYLKMDDRMFVI